MFIVWGRKLVYRKLGHVADFCPICRCARPFQLMRVGSAGHIYYVTAGEGQLVGFERTCQKCATTLPADPDLYATVLKKPVPLTELARQTFPNLAVVLRDRLALESRIRHDLSSLSRDDRRALIKSPFTLLSPKVEKRFASTHLDKEIGLAFAAAIGLIAFGPGLVHKLLPELPTDLTVLAFIGASVLLVLWQLATAGRRFMQRQIIPVLSRSLQPLRPTKEELAAVLAELKTLGHKIGKKLKPADLLPTPARP